MSLHGILVVDKPRGWTSHDVVALVRRLTKTKRVGHAGTLDPAAEGVLVVAVGRATKLIDALQQSTKEYVAHIVLGRGSVSGDIEGPLVQPDGLIDPPSIATIRETAASFIGAIEQTPPAHSAIKIGGRAAYQFAHQGRDIELPARRVAIHALEVLEYAYPDVLVATQCSPGTYIRSLARDIGEALGTWAYLHFLLRTRSGQLNIADAWTVDGLREHLTPGTFAAMALHPDAALSGTAAIQLEFGETRAWYDGRPVGTRGDPETLAGQASAYRYDGDWLGVGVPRREAQVWQPQLVVADKSFKAQM